VWSIDEPATDPADFEQRVVDDVQQFVHDSFADTSWPACPEHPTHPLWFSEGWVAMRTIRPASGADWRVGFERLTALLPRPHVSNAQAARHGPTGVGGTT
jgi:hypothetical protein